MLKDIIKVQPADGYILRLTFEDGLEGDVDISRLIDFTGVFSELKAIEFFKSVSINAECGTIVWPNGADIDPDVLYAEVSGQPVADAIQKPLSSTLESF